MFWKVALILVTVSLVKTDPDLPGLYDKLHRENDKIQDQLADFLKTIKQKIPAEHVDRLESNGVHLQQMVDEVDKRGGAESLPEMRDELLSGVKEFRNAVIVANGNQDLFWFERENLFVIESALKMLEKSIIFLKPM